MSEPHLIAVIRKRNQRIRRLCAKVRYLEVMIAEIKLALEGTPYDGVPDAVRDELEALRDC